ncbi:hypothetical protein HAX54_012314, partial [Datura stramonium]|nr:hypothetical protein [Datura stramonium]
RLSGNKSRDDVLGDVMGHGLRSLFISMIPGLDGTSEVVRATSRERCLHESP